MSEFAPPGSNPRMTKQQINKYNRERDKAKAIAKAKLERAIQNGELDNSKEIEEIEKLMEEEL